MPTNTRYICIHGHFYQPPRENPWLEAVELQDSAAPYHDWNERVCAECYAPNGAARTVNTSNKITRITNNYARISFNFGPTLLSWLKECAPRTYRMVLNGEKRSRDIFNGHSSAMAQVYNHIILPLANKRDRITQIRWGIADYISRYGIAPEGMWLAETAADTDSLELLAQHGIKFTVLAPRQCKRVRSLKGGEDWINTQNASVDTSRPYLMRFKSGASIAIFFYNGEISQAIAFEGLLNSGDNFAARLKSGFRDSTQPQLVHVATDGESYGHHHRYGEMALAYAQQILEADPSVTVTNYGSYLEMFPPDQECEIVDNSSWSCEHGVERWRFDCGCNSGRQGWNQRWRAPLRQALDELRDAVAALTEKHGSMYFTDVWNARNEYIHVMLDRSEESVDMFLVQQQNHLLTKEERVHALELMEAQRHAQLMYTSCGWFFDDISGIETVQILAYAGRVLQLIERLYESETKELRSRFMQRLAEAQSNVLEEGDGAKIYRQHVQNLELNLDQVAAHYAISSVFSSYDDETDMFSFRARRISYEIYTSGRGRLALGRALIRNKITSREYCSSFAVLHFGDQNISAAVKSYTENDASEFEQFAAQVADTVQRADVPAVIRLIDHYYGQMAFSLTSLFTDEQRRIVQLLLKSTLTDIENSLKNIYEDHASLLHYLSRAGLPKPAALTLAAEFAVNAGLRDTMESDPIDQAQMRSFLALAKADQVTLDKTTLSYIADHRMKRAMADLQLSAGSLESLDHALVLVSGLTKLPFELNLWQAQNIWYEIFRNPHTLTELSQADRQQWDVDFCRLGGYLSIDYDAIRKNTPISILARN